MSAMYEYCASSLPHHTYNYLPQNELHGKPGFRSYFGYLGDTLYCDSIVIDVDNAPDSVPLVTEVLTKLGVFFAVFTSGSKGHHFHIAITPITSNDAPYSIKSWIKATFGAIPGIDTSMIHAKGLIRLPGTIHHKTGRQKELVEVYDGEDLFIPVVSPPVKESISSTHDLYFAIKRINFFLRNPPMPGVRHKTLWRLAKGLADAGMQYPHVLHTLLTVNQSWPDPKPDKEVIKIVQSILGAKHE